MSSSPVRRRRDCPSFRPGHMTHWIQARLSWRQYADQRWPVADVDVEDSGLLVLAMADGTVEHRWTHDPRFVRARLADPDRSRVQLAEPALLKVGRTCVSVCRLEDIVRCPTDTDVDALSLEERLEQLGGFIVPGRDLTDGAVRSGFRQQLRSWAGSPSFRLSATRTLVDVLPPGARPRIRCGPRRRPAGSCPPG